ncbi:MAG: hypothetical protein JWQ58_1216 [Reyranella sp.]|nr:hypothetical protein [Reyranella sp.]
MPIDFLNRVRGGSSRAFDSDVLSWRDAVVVNGGSVSLARLIVVDQFVFSEKTSGAWALTDDYWGFWAENTAQALTSLKQRRLATVVNSPVFTADRDFTFDGTTNYINSGFIPSLHGVNYKTTDQRLAVYERTNVSAAGLNAGVQTGTTNRVGLVARSGSTMVGTINNGGVAASFTISPADSRGLKAVSRAGGGTIAAGFDRGVRLTDATGFTTGANIQNIALFIGALNNAGTPGSFRANALGFAAIGGPLGDAQEAAQYAAVQAWATSVGANV